MGVNITGGTISSITTQDFSSLGLAGNYAQSKGMDVTADIAKTESFQAALDRAQAKDDPEELMTACKQFETYFIGVLFKEMRKTIEREEDSLIPRSMAEDYFQESLDDEYSKTATESGGIGLAKFLYAQLSGEYNPRPVSPFQTAAAAAVMEEPDENSAEA